MSGLSIGLATFGVAAVIVGIVLYFAALIFVFSRMLDQDEDQHVDEIRHRP